jgi:hypothetical protein
MLSGSVALTANAEPASTIAKIGPGGIGKTEITHAGTSSQSIFFDVKVENSEGKRFLIFVKDENGNTLYRGVYNSKDFSKRFVVPRFDSNKITFVIKGESENKSESFEINSNTRVIEEVVVTKVI